MERERVFLDQLGRKFRVKPPVPLSEPPKNLRIERQSKPWNAYFRMLGTVVPAYLLMYATLYTFFGFLNLEPAIVSVCGLVGIPFLMLIFWLHKPRLVHVTLAVPNELGSEAHTLPNGRTIKTQVKTNISRFIIKDDTILEVPPGKTLWSIFAIVLSLLVFLAFLIFGTESQTGLAAGVAIYAVLAIPLWLVGFSLPVLAWWGTSTRLIGLPTRRREAEAWLLAGMLSAFPAIIFNSFIFPLLLPFDAESFEYLLSVLAIGAPVGEEIFKAIAVVLFLPSINGPKKGFQVGYTVGLGFALIENLQYILFSFAGGPISASLTILVRGVGSIPGHAIWTAITGTAIGWLAKDEAFKNRILDRSKSIGIAVVDFAEGFGIDMDGDGDLSGYDGRRTHFEGFSEESPNADSIPKKPPSWHILGESGEDNSFQSENPHAGDKFSLSYVERSQNSSNSGLKTPRGVVPAILVSIIGHSIWNGTSALSYQLPIIFGRGETEAIVSSLAWTLVLVSSVLLFTRGMLREISLLED